jgi:hypothetical protein
VNTTNRKCQANKHPRLETGGCGAGVSEHLFLGRNSAKNGTPAWVVIISRPPYKSSVLWQVVVVVFNMSTACLSVSTKGLLCEVLPDDSPSAESFRLVHQTSDEIYLSFSGFVGGIRLRRKAGATTAPVADYEPTSLCTMMWSWASWLLGRTGSLRTRENAEPSSDIAPTASVPIAEPSSDIAPTASVPIVDITWTVQGEPGSVAEEEVNVIKRRWLKEYAEAGEGATVKKIDMSQCTWRAEYVHLLFTDIVESHRLLDTVEVLLLNGASDMLTPEERLATLAAIVSTFKRSSVVSVLDLSRNRLGGREIEVLQPLLTRPTVRELCFRDCELKDCDMAEWRRILLPVAPRLSGLDLRNNESWFRGGVEISKLLERCGNLRSFYAGQMFDSELNHIWTCFLMQGLVESGTTSLEVLDCPGCCYRTELSNYNAVRDLATVLSRNQGLVHLNLSGSKLEPKQVEVVIDSLLESRATLVHLSLNDLNLKDSGVKLLSEFLSFQTASLQSLQLAINGITCEGVSALLVPLGESCHLSLLDLEGNRIGEPGRQRLRLDKLRQCKVLLDNNIVQSDEEHENAD